MYLNCSTTEDEGIIICNGTHYEERELITPDSPLFWTYLALYALLVLFAGVASGLTMGLLSLDITSLKVLQRGGKPKIRKYASRIITVVKNHHLLLVTLLLANATAAETMPIFLGKITTEVVAILVSVTAVLLFGEIIPQALCTRYGLAIGYYASPLVVALMAVFFIISYPIAKLLDCLLGSDHGTLYRRAELRELVDLHGQGHSEANDEEVDEVLTYDEVLIIKCALEMKEKFVRDAMTHLQGLYMLSIDTVLNQEQLDEIQYRGHSRIPIYEGRPDNIVGILLAKRLIKINPRDNVVIRNLKDLRHSPPICYDTDPLYDMLNRFQTGRSHIFCVYQRHTSKDREFVGIITLEDVIEELIGEEIYDESDIQRDWINIQRKMSGAASTFKAGLRRQSSVGANIGVPGNRFPRAASSQLFQRLLSVPNYESMRKKQGYELLAEDQNLSNSNTNEPSLTSVGDEPDQGITFLPAITKKASPINKRATFADPPVVSGGRHPPSKFLKRERGRPMPVLVQEKYGSINEDSEDSLEGD